RLEGRIVAERLPLPEVDPRAEAPLGLDRLGLLDAELVLQAARVEPLGGTELQDLSATLHLAQGTLQAEGVKARLAGGTLGGALQLDGTAEPPRLAVTGSLADATIAGPLTGLPLDLSAGLVSLTLDLHAAGHGWAAMGATLEGTLSATVRDGVLVGVDLPAVQAAAGQAELKAAEAGLREALSGGATAFEALTVEAAFSEGRAALTAAALQAEGGVAASATGFLDLARGTLDLRIATVPAPGAPEVAVRLTGPAEAPRRTPELAPFLRWKAERG
ncbi:MAG TPA: AsmA-like C-terminal region-containing protein, partial [Crenalkalicoccus sp.]|nr:AsmA-like C-terminal region-containing protein [Crenalkalicoccus sp.]